MVTQTCPGLVERVEAALVEEAGTKEMLEEYLQPLLEAGIDSLVLGCTHYPFLKPLMKEIVGDDVEIIDPSLAVARQTARVLERDGLLREEGQGQLAFYTSGDPQVFARLIGELTSLKGMVAGARWLRGELILSSSLHCTNMD